MSRKTKSKTEAPLPKRSASDIYRDAIQGTDHRPEYEDRAMSGFTWDEQKKEGAFDTGALTPEQGEKSSSNPYAFIEKMMVEDWPGIDWSLIEIVPGSLSVIAWESSLKGVTPDMIEAGTKGKQKLLRYKVRLQERTKNFRFFDDAEWGDLLASARKKKSPAPIVPAASARSMLILLSDLQIGKGEGDGTLGTVARFNGCVEDLLRKIKEYKKTGRMPEEFVIVGMGDLVEQCFGFYPNQRFTVDLNRRQQLNVVFSLVMSMIDALVDHFPEVPIKVTGVAGNHGEGRDDSGRAFTDIEDNDDLLVFDFIDRLLKACPDRYGNVDLFLPKRLDLRVDIAGIPVGFIHGHQCGKGGGHAAAKLEKWWKDHVMGYQEVAGCHILVSGHLHHFVCSTASGRTVFQCPSLDPGSEWYMNYAGSGSTAGILTFMVGPVYGEMGWGDVSILGWSHIYY